jgi:alkylation response protein AidB-like acyl-CoA dehydrogenase
MLLDACRSMIYTTSRAVDMGAESNYVRRLISETKKFVTEACQKVAHNAMQVMGGIGYTNIFPVERIFRDLRLASIWTGSNEVMSMIIASEWYKEYSEIKAKGIIRDSENDSAEAFAPDEKIYE